MSKLTLQLELTPSQLLDVETHSKLLETLKAELLKEIERMKDSKYRIRSLRQALIFVNRYYRTDPMLAEVPIKAVHYVARDVMKKGYPHQSDMYPIELSVQSVKYTADMIILDYLDIHIKRITKPEPNMKHAHLAKFNGEWHLVIEYLTMNDLNRMVKDPLED